MLVIREQKLVESNLIQVEYLLGRRDVDEISAGIVVCCKTQVDAFQCSWNMLSSRAALLV
jgi:hypothetical protein